MSENKLNISKNLSDFFNTISKNQEEVEKLFSLSNVDEMYKYALSKSESGFSKEEFKEALSLVMKCLKNPESNKISDNELENVTGGKDEEETLMRSIAMMAPAIASLLETLLNLGYKVKVDNYQKELMKENKTLNDLEKKKQEYELRIQIENYKNELELRQKNKNKNKNIVEEIKNN